MKAYLGNPKLKAQYLARVKGHAKADAIVKGQYWENGKGCAVGCTIHSGNHAEYETALGIPEMLARLEDTIFEGLPNGKAKAWPAQFLGAIKPGADLSLVGWKFQHWLQTENYKRAVREKMPADVIASIRACADVLVPLTKGQKVDENAARSAGSAAWSAESAAWSAGSAAWSARSAGSAAWSAESAAWSEWSAGRSAAARAAASAAYVKMSENLLSLLKAAK